MHGCKTINLTGTRGPIICDFITTTEKCYSSKGTFIGVISKAPLSEGTEGYFYKSKK